MRPPLVIVACVSRGLRYVFRLRDLQPPVNWRETFTDMAARFFVGLLAGGGISLFLWPALFWPGTRSGRSILEQLGWSDRGGWILLTVLIGAAVFGALSTRVSI
ncbi:MAG: hypothetical protein QHJ82_16290 [Verrucomicrobiota bacterium]|nr:hypothetical protein [Verrucomicrobiota bacterium]